MIPLMVPWLLRMELDFHRDPSILSRVIDATADGLFTVDAQGLFVAWSRGAERITGYARDDVVGQPCTLLEGANCKGFAKILDLLREPPAGDTDGIAHQECKILAKDGRELYIHGNVRLVTDEQGRVAGAVGTFTDLTAFVLANERLAVLEEQTRQRQAFERLIGASDAMQEVFRRLRLAAQSDVTVFLSGDSGTGKELAARAIHSLSQRADKPFIAVNCSALPESLLESELFGHVKGAFTGAVKDRTGLIETANGGTFFLDEIGDVSPLLQLKLLRVLQEREIQRVGDERPRRVDVRLITATNQNLKSQMGQGKFREDFYYRIHVFEIRMPPLRERRDDIPLLAEHFIRELSQVHQRAVTGIARDALDQLQRHDWPGNVRELRNAIEHAFVTVSGDTITLLDLPADVRASPERIRPATSASSVRASPAASSWSAEEESERRKIADVLDAVGGNKTKAAKRLGISRVTMWKKSKKYGFMID